MIYALKSISQVSEEIHKVEPNSRLFTIAVSHYDSISPLAKSILGMPMENYLKVDYLGGFSVVADQSTRLKAKISGQEYVIK
jgi:hypothetical protein